MSIASGAKICYIFINDFLKPASTPSVHIFLDRFYSWISDHFLFRALVVLYRMLTIFACYVFDIYVWDAVSIFNHLPRMFLSTDFAFRITDWTCCHGPHLHAILRIIGRGVSGLATDSPCGVWDRGWTTCLLRDSPLFGSHFKMRVGL